MFSRITKTAQKQKKIVVDYCKKTLKMKISTKFLFQIEILAIQI